MIQLRYMKKEKTTPKKRASNTGYGKSGRKATLKKAAKDLKEKVLAKMEEKLSPKEEKFCQLYVSDVEFYGNGTQSYIEAFNVEIIRGTNKYKSKSNSKNFSRYKVQFTQLTCCLKSRTGSRRNRQSEL